MTSTPFPQDDGPTAEQQAAEAQALEVGEQIALREAEDRELQFKQAEDSNELIAGKFRTQEDLLKAYEELQRKLGENEPAEEPEQEQQEEQPEEEVEEEETSDPVKYMEELGQEFDKSGELSEDAIERLSSMDSKDLIKAYLEYNSKAQAASMQQAEVQAIQDSVGGQEAYSELIQWASTNLDQSEIDDFNAVTNTNNPQAIKFAVQALNSRYREGTGYEAPLVSGTKSGGGRLPAYRSHGELARDIADPRYATDEAFRQDVMARMERSGDLL